MTQPPSADAVDALLRQDPCGAYAGMDAPTRERYLRTVRHLAAHARAGTGAEGVARAALRRAGEAADDAEASPAAAHVGYHLVGPGAPALEREVGYRPPPRTRAYRFLWRHPTSVYLGSCSALSAALLAPVVAYTVRQGAGAGMAALAGAAVLPLALEAAVFVARGLLHPRFPLRVLPKMDFAAGIPDEHRTLVVVPTLLRSPWDARRQVAALERMAEENPDPGLRFALLSDFADAPERSVPGDAEILDAAAEAVRQLNARHPEAGGDRFLVLHRERAWNPDEGTWTGWLRKIGKLEELYRLLREPGAETGFRWVFGSLPAAGAGAPFRYVITLDETDRLEPGAAAGLVRTAAHPLNRPRVDATRGRVTEGYGLLQPATRTAPGVRTRYTELVHGPPVPDTPDAKPRFKPHFYTDVFGAGQFQGKGLVDVDAWRAVLGGVVNPTVLTHDILESLYARAAHVGDVGMVAGPVDRCLVQMSVEERWIRGDCQLAPWLLPRVHDRAGAARRNPLPWTLRLRLLRFALAALVRPAALAVLLLGWTVLPGSALAWTAVGLSNTLLQQGRDTAVWLGTLARPGKGGRRVGWREYLGRTRFNALGVATLAQWAVVAGRGIGRGVWRSLVSRKLRTQWVTQRQSAAQPLTPGHYLRVMWPSAALGAGVLPLVAAAAPERLPVAAPFALLWMAAPLWVWRLDRPLPPAASAPAPGKPVAARAAS